MENRIGFKSDKLREEFFSAVKNNCEAQSWDELARKFGLGRSHFQGYQYGKVLLPETLFQKMVTLLPLEKANLIIESIYTLQGNWGRSKGGKATYKSHPEIFAKGRRINSINRAIAALQPNNIEITLSEDLCELIGAIIGDGCITAFKKKSGLPTYNLCITGHSILDKDYLTKYLSEIIKQLFNVNCKTSFRNDCNGLILKFNSKNIYSLLTTRFEFIPGKKAYTVKIPQEIINSNEKFMFAVTRGIFDTDGCVFFDKRGKYKSPYPRIVLQIKSKPLFLQLKNFLETHFSLYARESNSRNTCCLEIYGKEQFKKWMNLIGFSNKKHLERIQKNYLKLQAGIAPATSASL